MNLWAGRNCITTCKYLCILFVMTVGFYGLKLISLTVLLLIYLFSTLFKIQIHPKKCWVCPEGHQWCIFCLRNREDSGMSLTLISLHVDRSHICITHWYNLSPILSHSCNKCRWIFSLLRAAGNFLTLCFDDQERRWHNHNCASG